MGSTSESLSRASPLASPLGPAPEIEVLTDSQWTTLMAIGDTVVPSIATSGSSSLGELALADAEYESVLNNTRTAISPTADRGLAHAYLIEHASSNSCLRELVRRMLSECVRQDARKGIASILSALNTRIGCLLLTGSATVFHQQQVHARQSALRKWHRSFIPPLKVAAKALASLFQVVWIRTSPTIGPALGYARAPVLARPGKDFEYNFLQLPPGDAPEVLETDVVIIGSGCGGGVCAKNLAEAGHHVIITERAYHFPSQYFPMAEADAGFHLYQNGGVIPSDDNSISVIAGQAWGGGGTVNWSASLQTSPGVRQEWAASGLPFFASSEYQEANDRVCKRMGVSSEDLPHNRGNQVLLDGARKIGYNGRSVPQNNGGRPHEDGYCTLGCGSGVKQGPAVTFLPDAQRAGAQYLEGFDAGKIRFETKEGRQHAVGVEGVWQAKDSNGSVVGADRATRKVIINAKRVIVSCGTLQSPLLLLRSGLKNSQIGRNLHMHAATVFGARFDDAVDPWQGPILTSMVDDLSNLDGAYHGATLETTAMLPSYFLPFLPWTGGAAFKAAALALRRTAGFVSIVRDRDPGRVYPDPADGKPRVAYSPSQRDRALILQGVEALAKICYAAGARELLTTTAGVPTFVRKGDVKAAAEGTPAATAGGADDAEFQAWLALVRNTGLPSPETSFAAAHQMGTCRMGASEKDSVVDPSGKVWSVEGLYVADASVFPSASGVNPMVTVMAISDWISRGIGKGLARVRE